MKTGTKLILSALGIGMLILLLADDGPPAEAESGTPVELVAASEPLDLTASGTAPQRLYRSGTDLHVERNEWFYSSARIAAPTITRTADGVVVIHVRVHEPSFRLFASKCELARRIHLRIPLDKLAGARQLLIANHDTHERELVADAAAIGQILASDPVTRVASDQPLRLSGSSGC